MKRIFFIIIIISVSILFNTCKKEDKIAPEEEIKISENAVVASQSTINDLIGVDSLKLTFNSSASQVQNLKVGSILVIPKDGGYLRKIKSVSTQGNTIEVTTENARLDEVIEKGAIEMEFELKPEDLTKCIFSDKKMNLRTDGSKFTISFNKVMLQQIF